MVPGFVPCSYFLSVLYDCSFGESQIFVTMIGLCGVLMPLFLYPGKKGEFSGDAILCAGNVIRS